MEPIIDQTINNFFCDLFNEFAYFYKNINHVIMKTPEKISRINGLKKHYFFISKFQEIEESIEKIFKSQLESMVESIAPLISENEASDLHRIAQLDNMMPNLDAESKFLNLKSTVNTILAPLIGERKKGISELMDVKKRRDSSTQTDRNVFKLLEQNMGLEMSKLGLNSKNFGQEEGRVKIQNNANLRNQMFSLVRNGISYKLTKSKTFAEADGHSSSYISSPYSKNQAVIAHPLSPLIELFNFDSQESNLLTIERSDGVKCLHYMEHAQSLVIFTRHNKVHRIDPFNQETTFARVFSVPILPIGEDVPLVSNHQRSMVIAHDDTLWLIKDINQNTKAKKITLQERGITQMRMLRARVVILLFKNTHQLSIYDLNGQFYMHTITYQRFPWCFAIDSSRKSVIAVTNTSKASGYSANTTLYFYQVVEVEENKLELLEVKKISKKRTQGISHLEVLVSESDFDLQILVCKSYSFKNNPFSAYLIHDNPSFISEIAKAINIDSKNSGIYSGLETVSGGMVSVDQNGRILNVRMQGQIEERALEERQ